MFQTPDTGEFRVWGLSPGEYLHPGEPCRLAVDRSRPQIAQATRQPFIRTRRCRQKAQVVRVRRRPDRERHRDHVEPDPHGADQRHDARLARPAAAQRFRVGDVAVARHRCSSCAAWAARSNPTGHSRSLASTPGTYMVRASVPPAGGGAVPETLVATVTVAGDDVSGVVLMPLQPATITGRVLFDPPTQSLEPSMLQLMVAPKNPRMMMPMPVPGPAGYQRRLHVRSEGGAGRRDRARDATASGLASGREISDA